MRRSVRINGMDCQTKVSYLLAETCPTYKQSQKIKACEKDKTASTHFGKSHGLPHACTKWHTAKSKVSLPHVCTIPANQCPSLTCFVLLTSLRWWEWWFLLCTFGFSAGWYACQQILHVGKAHSVFHTTCAMTGSIRVIRLGMQFFALPNICLQWCLRECAFLPNRSMCNFDCMRRRATCTEVSDNRNTFLVRIRHEVRLTKTSEVVEGKLFVDCSTAVATLLSRRMFYHGVNAVRISVGLGSKKITHERWEK